MVSKKHLSSASVKRFKKVHVAHKVFVANTKRTEVVVEKEIPAPVVKEEVPVVEQAPVVEELAVAPVEQVVEEQKEETPAPKKTTRKKKVTETENNEENTESHE